MLIKLFAWVPFRASGLSSGATTQSPFTMSQFFSSSFPNYPTILTAFIILYSLTQINKHRPLKILWFILITGLIGIALHRNPPIHYFLPLLPIPILLAGVSLSRLPRILLAITLTWSIVFMPFPNPPTGPTYSDQLSLAKSIIFLTANHPYTLNRVGMFDNYPGQAAESYRYLLGWLGHPPNETASLHITIHEENNQLFFTQNPL